VILPQVERLWRHREVARAASGELEVLPRSAPPPSAGSGPAPSSADPSVPGSPPRVGGASARRRIVAIDLDHTLVRGNTHHELSPVLFAATSRWRSLLYRCLTTRGVARLVGFLLGDDPRRWLSVRLLAGYDDDELERQVEQAFGDRWREMLSPGVLTLLQAWAADPATEVVLVSAAPGFIARFFAARLGIGSLASEIGGGRYELDLTDRKTDLLLERYPGAELFLVASDRLADLDPRFRHRVLVRDGRTFLETRPESIAEST